MNGRTLPSITMDAIEDVLQEQRPDGHEYYYLLFSNVNPPNNFTRRVRDCLRNQSCDWTVVDPMRSTYIAHFNDDAAAREEQLRVVERLHQENRGVSIHSVLSKCFAHSPEYLAMIERFKEMPQIEPEDV